jgi:MGT family glycosyltransferase
MKVLDFLFATADLGGNVSPVMPVVRRLIDRGHHVRVMSEGSVRAEAEAAGARFVGWRRAPNKQARARENELPDWDVPVKEGIGMVARFLGGTALAYAEDMIEELNREPADLVVSFDMLIGPMLGCEAIGQKLALLGTMISFFPLKGIPPLGSAMAPARTEAERAAEERAHLEFQALFDAALPDLNAAREKLGLPPLAHLADQLDAAKIHWLGTARAFDFAGAALRPAMRYAGPLIGDPSWARPWSSPWPEDDGRPLLLVGFSTSFQNHAGVLQRVIDAAAALPVRLLVTLGGSIRPDEVTPAANTVVMDSAPHDLVMRDAALVITHGGHGTVMTALMHRLPMLIIPHGRDQGDNAVRVTERGAGLSLPQSASTDEIRTALRRLLDEETFRNAARLLGDVVAEEAKASTLIDDIEALARAHAAEPTLVMAG